MSRPSACDPRKEMADVGVALGRGGRAQYDPVLRDMLLSGVDAPPAGYGDESRAPHAAMTSGPVSPASDFREPNEALS